LTGANQFNNSWEDVTVVEEGFEALVKDKTQVKILVSPK
jgi:hypothetical protein